VKNDSSELPGPASTAPESSENRSPETPGLLFGAQSFQFSLGSLPSLNGARVEWVSELDCLGNFAIPVGTYHASSLIIEDASRNDTPVVGRLLGYFVLRLLVTRAVTDNSAHHGPQPRDAWTEMVIDGDRRSLQVLSW
jgi:hypothetical protein